MVYCMALQPILRDVVPGSVIKTNPDAILRQLVFDPDITQMDVLILNTQDVEKFDAKQLRKALKTKHPDICVIYVKDHTDDHADLKYASYNRTVRKITHDALEDIFIECVNEFKLNTDKHLVSSNDFKEIS